MFRHAGGALLILTLTAASLSVTVDRVGATVGQADAAIGADDNPACPSPNDVARQAAARFSDIDADYGHAANIGCLVYYGITVGAGDGSGFAPDRLVTRWQMALFLTRAAKRAGVKLPKEDQGFTDVSELSTAVTEGVNAAAALGIMPGTSATEFSPGEPVLRSDMGLYLVRTLELVTDTSSPINVTVDDSSGAVTMARRDGTIIAADDSFDDLAGVVSEAEEHAIAAIYELGVTTGKRPGEYNPGGRVTRAHMASFIIRLLGHSTLRPDGAITLPPWRPGAPPRLSEDPNGVYRGDPLHLIAYASFERAYSLPDGDGDVLEVWLCNTPASEIRYSTHEDNRHNPANYADKFASQVTAWFEWLSDGVYTPVFRAGGVVEVGSADDYYRECDDAVLARDFRGRPDVDGVVVVVGAAVAEDGIIGSASCGFFSKRGFPENSRSILVNGDAFTDPVLLAHEMGHALCWPHSYSGETYDSEGDVWEYDNPMDIMGSPVDGQSDPVPLIGTPAINRYASGWIATKQVRIHKQGTTARYELSPPGKGGVQLLVIPYDNDDRRSYLALGARVTVDAADEMWWADAGIPAEGVEIYEIDQSAYGCELPDRGYCYGLERRTQPIFDEDDGYDQRRPTHVMTESGDRWYWGEVGEPVSFIVELVSIDGGEFVVDVSPLLDEPEAGSAEDWEVGTGSMTAGDFNYVRTYTSVGSDDAPDWLRLVIRCRAGSELDIYLRSDYSHFSGIPTLEYRFGSQRTSTTLEMSASTTNEAGFLNDRDIPAFIRQLRADDSGILHIELWDRPTYGGSADHEAGGVLEIEGVETQVEPILTECGQ